MSSIKKKITSSYILIIVVTVIIIQVILYTVLRSYYYNSLKDTVEGQIKISSDFYNTYLSSNTIEDNVFNNTDMFWSNTQCEVQIINSKGKILMDSLGYISDEPLLTSEVKESLNGGNKPVSVVYKANNKREKSISVAMPLYHDTNVDGVLRFTSSTREIDRSINKIFLIIMSLGILVIVVSSTVSIFIGNSIMKPLKLVCIGAENMANGNFKETIPKYSKDEIGKLADTLNYMSQEILKNERLKNEFISSVSHELRTPLTSIKGWTIVLESSDLSDKEEILEGLGIIDEEVERLSLLVEELLDFSKLVSGKLTLNKEQTEINEFLKSIIKQLEPPMTSQGISLKLRQSEKMNLYIDRNRMKQVLINILDNSIKYCKVNDVIELDFFRKNNDLEIHITDYGCGISKEDLPHIKDKFYKGKNSKAGSGIGLSVCDEIIMMHNGKLSIDSEEGTGTKVTILLPIGD
ncbi:MAG: HAMP domain-containing sensor histidine kinase [Clostridium sp.]|nr:HAMP domain-containing sensor histidine kinase [Clostridium sp.]